MTDRAIFPGEEVTYLLTDVAGSTAMWEASPDAMASSLARHDQIVAAAAAATGGAVLHPRGEGDSRFVVFTEPVAAAAAALAVVNDLQAEVWPESAPIVVRICLHTAPASDDHYGPEVNRAATLRSMAQPGQILLSATTAAALRGRVPPRCHVADLGDDVFQLCHPDLTPERSPQAHEAGGRRGLPEATTSLVGRDDDIAEVGALIERARLVTLTGIGGTGKTRLGLAVATQATASFPDGVSLVELASISDPALVPQAVAAAVGVREAPDRPLLETLAGALGTRVVLLVLDNCEHLRTAAAETARYLLEASPRLRVLATSREPLGLSGETTWLVPPLAAPPSGQADPDTIPSFAAAALFIDRAHGAQPDFVLTTETASLVAELCRRLDGIPLALELAAAQLDRRSLADVAGGIEDHLRLSGSNDNRDRHRTLEATLAWSHDLLSPSERALFRRLAVFSSGAHAQAAETVASGDPVVEDAVWDLLASLVDRSLVAAVVAGESTRYRMLETVRAYALERLEDAAEGHQARDRHLAWVLAVTEANEPGVEGRPEFPQALERMLAEDDNLRAALTWSRTPAWSPIGVRLVAAASQFWWAAGRLEEGRAWVRAALEAMDIVNPRIRAKLLQHAGQFALGYSDYREAIAHLRASADLARTAGDAHVEARSLSSLAWAIDEAGDYAGARPVWREGLAVARRAGDDIVAAQILHNMGYTASAAGNLSEGEELLSEALVLARACANDWQLAYTLSDLGNTVAARGDAPAGLALCQEALALARKVGDRPALMAALDNEAQLAFDAGETERAQALWREALTLAVESNLQLALFGSLDGVGQTLAMSGGAGAAVRLLAAADAIRRSSAVPRLGRKAAAYEQALDRTRAALGDAAFEEAWAAGRALSVDDAVRLAHG